MRKVACCARAVCVHASACYGAARRPRFPAEENIACDYLGRVRRSSGISLQNRGFGFGTDLAIVAEQQALGHEIEVIDGPYHYFGAGQFIWCMGNPAIEGYLIASAPRRDGLAAGF